MIDETPNPREWGIEVADRTPFYPLSAEAIGTPFVEGLTGYLRRLATAHGVTVPDLICHSHFDEQFVKPDDLRTRRRLFLANGYLLDGAGDYSGKWAEALENATGQTGLRNLTLVPFSGINPYSWLRRRRAWCPYCLAVQANNDPEGIYEQLLWSIRLVSVCPIDLTPLMQHCPNCRASLTPFAGVASPGYCGRCGGPLWDKRRVDVLSTAANDTPLYEIWCSIHMCLLLGASNEFTTPLLASSIGQVLGASFDSALEQSRRAVAAKAGCSKRTTYLWANGLALPRIESLFRICFNLGLTPLNIFRRALLASSDIRDLSDTAATSGSSSGGGFDERQLEFNFPFQKSHDRLCYDSAARSDQIKTELRKALELTPPPTLHAIATALKMSSSTGLRSLEPDLCNQIDERRKQWEEKELLRIKATFEAVLCEPILSISFERFCFQSKFPLSMIRRELPDLKAAYIAKYRTGKDAQRTARAEENRMEVERVLDMICRGGEYPSVGRVKSESAKLHSVGWDEIQKAICNYFASRA